MIVPLGFLTSNRVRVIDPSSWANWSASRVNSSASWASSASGFEFVFVFDFFPVANERIPVLVVEAALVIVLAEIVFLVVANPIARFLGIATLVAVAVAVVVAEALDLKQTPLLPESKGKSSLGARFGICFWFVETFSSRPFRPSVVVAFYTCGFPSSNRITLLHNYRLLLPILSACCVRNPVVVPAVVSSVSCRVVLCRRFHRANLLISGT